MNDTVPVDVADDEISLLDLLQTVVDNLRLLLVGPLAVGLMALGVSFIVTPTFTAKTQFLPPQQQQSSAASMLASLGSLGGFGERYAEAYYRRRGARYRRLSDARGARVLRGGDGGTGRGGGPGRAAPCSQSYGISRSGNGSSRPAR